MKSIYDLVRPGWAKGCVIGLGLSGSFLITPPVLAHPDRADHGDRDHHSSADDSYWGRHVDAWRDHRYGDPTIHNLRLNSDSSQARHHHQDDDSDDADDDDPEGS